MQVKPILSIFHMWSILYSYYKFFFVLAFKAENDEDLSKMCTKWVMAFPFGIARLVCFFYKVG
jgi:hypothetical protein